MPSEIIEFPFDSGAYEAADREWLPPNLFAVVENLRLDLDGRLGVRPGFSAVSSSTYSANSATFYDLANYSGRLTALGDQTALGRATDLFEFVSGAAAWRATSGADTNQVSGPRLPRMTDVRQIGGIPDLDADARWTCTATAGGKVLMVVQLQNTARVHLFDPATDQTLVLLTTPLIQCRACFAGSNLWVVGQAVGNAIIGLRINPSTEEAFTQVTLVAAGTVGGVVVDIAAAQTGATDFTIAYTTGTNAIAARFNTSGTLQSTWTHTTDTIDALAVCGNAAGTRISVLWHDAVAKTHKFQTRTQTGAAVVGPTTVFSTETVIPRCGVAQTGSQICCAVQRTVTSGGSQTTNIESAVCTNEDTHAFIGQVVYADAVLTAAPVGFVSGGRTDFYFGAIDRLAELSGVGTAQLVQQTQVLPQCFLSHALGGGQVVTNNSLGSCSIIGTKLYWGTTIKSIAPRQPDETTFGISGVVVEMESAGTARRPMVQLANELHIAGALPLVYDGRYTVDHGFAERPVCALTQASGGGKFAAGVYQVQVTWEVVDSRGNILRSAVSEPKPITMTDSAILVSATTPHSLRRHPLLQADAGLSVRVGFYCTTVNGGNFFLEAYSTVATSGTNFGEPLSRTLNAADTQIRDNPVLYTQSQTPLTHVSPPPYRYSWPGRERLIVGGLPNEEQWSESKLLFPSEPVEFATPGRLGFTGRSNQAITAVASNEASAITFTKSEIAIIPGRGPEHNGTGEFDSAIKVRGTPGGCLDWRSLVDTPLGLFFQMQTDKLMLLKPSQNGIGDVVWAGQPIRQTLALFPVITGAVHVRSQMIVAFSCTNVAGDSGRVLIYDLRRDVWYVDTIGPVTSVSELDGRLVLLQAGAVSQQDLAAGSGTFIASAVQTGVIAVRKRLGWGHIYRVGLLGIDAGACSVQCLIDYDDGVGFRDLGTEAFTGTGLAFERFWSLSIQKTSRFALRWVVTSASSSSLGVRLNAWAAEVEGSKNMVRVGSGGVVR